MRGDSGGDRATGRDGGGRAAARATSASLCCPSTRARAAACIEAELMQPWRRASCLRGRSAALEPSIVHKPVPLKHESKSGIMYRSRADEAAAACVTPGTAISCERAEHRAPACAIQAREQEQQHVSKLRRRASRPLGRSAVHKPSIERKPVPPQHENKSGGMFRGQTDEAAGQASRLRGRSAANEPSSERKPLLLMHENKIRSMY